MAAVAGRKILAFLLRDNAAGILSQLARIGEMQNFPFVFNDR